MNDLINQAKQLCAGMSVDEIVAAIEASSNAGAVPDVQALAEALAG